MLKTIDMAVIRSFNPCYGPNKYLPEDFKGTALDILNNKSIPARDRLWVVLRDEILDDKILRLFAIACAESVLSNFESVHPDDKRPRQAIEIAKRYVQGLATKDELNDACLYAWAATESAFYASSTSARLAAEAAARLAAVDAAESALYASEAASEAPARLAVDSASYAEARSAACSAQINFLLAVINENN